MLGASFLPARLRHEHNQAAPSNPGHLNRQITPLLQTIARGAFTHPIHTIVFVAFLASTCYVGVLEGSLFERGSPGNEIGGTNISSLIEGSRRLRLGEETSWKWETMNGPFEGTATPRDPDHDGPRPVAESSTVTETTIMTLVFPDSLSNASPRRAPSIGEIALFPNSSVQQLPSTWNPLSPLSQDTSLAFAVPSGEAAEFLRSIQEIPTKEWTHPGFYDGVSAPKPEIWVIRSGDIDGKAEQRSTRDYVRHRWIAFVDLVKASGLPIMR